MNLKSKFEQLELIPIRSDEDNTTENDNKITTVDKVDQDDIESISIDEDNATGDVIATTTRLVKTQDGSSTKIKTTERFKNGKYYSYLQGSLSV